MDTIRIGVIGSGGISRGHAKRLIAMDGVTIPAVTEPSDTQWARFVETVLVDENAPKRYTQNHAEMLAGEELDAALICSPHTLHFQQIMDCLDAGLHVLVEKPMVCTTEHTQRVVGKAAATGKRVVVTYQRRFQPQFRYMKQFIQDPAFGALHMISILQTQAWWTGAKGKWRQDPKLSGGGQLNDSASHVIDVMNWMLPDPIVTVSAMIDNRGREVDIDSVVSFRTAGGTLGSLTVLGSAAHKGMCEDWTLSGDSGRCLFLRNDGPLGGTLGTREQGQPLEAVDVDGWAEKANRGAADPDTHFVDLLRGATATNESPPENFLATIGFTEACWRSAAAGGEPVSLTA
ncbi:MAG: Gfo/Idh/MocA family oxidoreductase [Phycisphaerae bacterium]|nr:Gfo/Idh/MocA family oxidoreductase [Phycisphaerae bacterium]